MPSGALRLLPTAGNLVLGLLLQLPAAVAHGGDAGHGGHGGGNSTADMPKDESEYPPSYFAHPEHVGVIYAHITLMVLAWVFVLPVSVMLSLAKSRYTLIIQFVFLGTNAIGLLLATIYNAQTPDLYPNNAHHKIGWIVTWIVAAQVTISLLGKVADVFSKKHVISYASEPHGFLPVSTEGDTNEYRVHNDRISHRDSPYRLSHDSNDSGQGTEPNTDSLRSHSLSTLGDEHEIPLESAHKEFEDEDDLEAMPFSSATRGGLLAEKATKVVSSRVWKYIDLLYCIIDRIILPLGFVMLTTGIVTFGRFFEGRGIFGGLAHFVKGGVFFWLGLFTLGRWSGSFGELGWAWNASPKRLGQKWRPSAEFVESFLIFFYGSTNVFLEHLGNWGGAWRPQDLEHFAVTILFIGGGLCGMLVESLWIRELLNSSVIDVEPEHTYSEEEQEQLQPPTTYQISLNPIPALVIMLLGIMMSSHTQESMTSSMVHKQWGNLFLGASFSRGFTYIIMYLKPPKSVLPSRPPTELLASFGLISGGIIFMTSASDTVSGMIHYQLDAMFTYTITMGLVGVLMAWELAVLAIKGWAVRQERRSSSRRIV